MTLNYTVVSLVLILLTGLAIDVQTASQQTKQEPLGKLYGLVLDSGNARVAKAKIVIEREGFRREVIAADDGRYEIELPVDSYSVTAMRYGFQPTRVAGVQVRANDVTSLDIVITGILIHEGVVEQELSTETAVPNNSIELRKPKPRR